MNTVDNLCIHIIFKLHSYLDESILDTDWIELWGSA